MLERDCSSDVSEAGIDSLLASVIDQLDPVLAGLCSLDVQAAEHDTAL